MTRRRPTLAFSRVATGAMLWAFVVLGEYTEHFRGWRVLRRYLA